MNQTRYGSDRMALGRRAAVMLSCVAAASILATCKPGSPADPVGPDPTDQRFSVTLEWNAPTEDAEGEPLEDLEGYRVHYRDSSPADGPGATTVDVGETTRATVTGIPAGTWSFGVTAMDVAGNESALSNEVRVEVGP